MVKSLVQVTRILAVAVVHVDTAQTFSLPSFGVFALTTLGYVTPLSMDKSIFTFAAVPRLLVHLTVAVVPTVHASAPLGSDTVR